MRTQLKKPLVIFILSIVLIALPLFLLPLNLFNGEIVYQHALVEQKVAAPLSLSYFIGIGYDQKDMVGVKEFYLVKDGIILAIIVLFGIPGIIAYRFHLKR
jgi:heme/copper-type cytochrome/quinol oxidase subunit 4